MRSSFFVPSVGTGILLIAALFASITVAQTPQSDGAQTSPAAEKRAFPAPTNLKVLPVNLSGEQVHDIMKQWSGALGVKCVACHKADPNDIGPNGRPRLNFADDSKPEKTTARVMYSMVKEINSQYIDKVENSGVPVSCGTCHRGHFGPEPFANQPED